MYKYTRALRNYHEVILNIPALSYNLLTSRRFDRADYNDDAGFTISSRTRQERDEVFAHY